MKVTHVSTQHVRRWLSAGAMHGKLDSQGYKLDQLNETLMGIADGHHSPQSQRAHK